MNIILDLFGIHIVFFSTILILCLSWLFWPRKNIGTRKILLRTIGLISVFGIILAFRAYWPYSYEKNYLNTPVSKEIMSTPLKALADSIDFNIGVAIASNSEFKELIAKEFNSVVAENDFKPKKLLIDPVHWKFDFSAADRLMEFSKSNGMRMRGHTLIWGKFPGRTYPQLWKKQIAESADKEETMKSIMTQYIHTVMGHFKGQISTWDVVNEPMAGEGLYPSPFTEAMGEYYIDWAFKHAHEIDPDCSLFLNEQIYDYDGPAGKAFLALLKRLKKRNVPIHGIGLQTHHIKGIHDLDGLKRFIRAIGELGLKVEITELDIRLLLMGNEDDPYEAQGVQFGEVVNICLRDQACEGVTFWGLTDKVNWMDHIPPFSWKSPNAPHILDEDMRKKPAYIHIWEALKKAQPNF